MTATFLEKYEHLIAYEPNSGCWLWTGFINPEGYGRIDNQSPHRAVYEETVGPIPAGLVLDHKCRVRCCVNPAHLEAVTNRENILRGVGITAQNAVKTVCVHGHPLTPENVRVVVKDGRAHRYCRPCGRQNLINHRARKRQASAIEETANG